MYTRIHLSILKMSYGLYVYGFYIQYFIKYKFKTYESFLKREMNFIA